MKMKFIFPLVFMTNFVLIGCAGAPEIFDEVHVSYFPYESFTCSQLSSEAEFYEWRVPYLYRALRETSDEDEAQMSAALILFWPILFYREYRAETQSVAYTQLVGERDRISRIAMKKGCANKKPVSTKSPMEKVSLRS